MAKTKRRGGKTIQRLLETRNKVMARNRYRKNKFGVDFTDIYGDESKDVLDLKKPSEYRSLTIKDMNKERKRLEQTLKDDTFKGSKNAKGVWVPKILKKEFEEVRSRIADKYEQEVTDKRPYYQVGGRDSGMTVGQTKMLTSMRMGQNINNTKNMLLPYDFDRATSVNDIVHEIKKRKLRTDDNWLKQNEIRMKNNYIKSLSSFFNSDADELIEMIEKVDPSDFVELFEMFGDINFTDIPSQQDVIERGKNSGMYNDDYASQKLQQLESIVKEFLLGNVDTRGQVFR